MQSPVNVDSDTSPHQEEPFATPTPPFSEKLAARLPLLGLLGFLALFAFIALALGASEAAVAQIPPNGDNAVDWILDPIRATFAAQRDTVLSSIERMFYFLALLEFVYSFGLMTLRGSATFNAFAVFFVERLIVLLLFFSFISNGWLIARAITDTAMTIGGNITGTQVLNPADIFDKGLKLSGEWMTASSSWFTNLTAALGMVISASAVFLLYVAIAGELVMVLAETYVLLLAGLFLLAFGGSSWTRSYAIAYFVWTLGAALKILVLYVILAMGFTVVDAWSVAHLSTDFNMTKALTLIGSLMLIWMMSRRLPSIAADMLRGFYTGGRSSLFDPLTTPRNQLGLGTLPGSAAHTAAKASSRIGVATAAAGMTMLSQSTNTLGSTMTGATEQSVNQVTGGSGSAHTGKANAASYSAAPGPARPADASTHSVNKAASATPVADPPVTGPRHHKR